MKRTIKFDTKRVRNKDDLHDLLATELELPDYYGRNLDALWDCLREVDEQPVSIIWSGCEDCKTNLGQYASKLLECFRDAPGVSVVIE